MTQLNGGNRTGHVLIETKRKYLRWEIGMRVRPEEENHTAQHWWNGFVHFGTGSSAWITEIATFLLTEAKGSRYWDQAASASAGSPDLPTPTHSPTLC